MSARENTTVREGCEETYTQKYARLRTLLTRTNIVLYKDSVMIDTIGNKEKAEILYRLLGDAMAEARGLN